MNYVLAVIQNFNAKNTEEIILKARGRAITTAVDVAEITRRQFLKEMGIKKITIGTEEITNEGKTRAVSTIEISLNCPVAHGEEKGKTDSSNK